MMWALVIVIATFAGYSEGQVCGGVIKQLRGAMATPNYNQQRYPPNVECVWEFPFRPIDVIYLSVEDIAIENGGTCEKDYLRFEFYGQKPQTICGTQTQKQQMAGSGPVKVIFASDAGNVGRGFRGVYLRYMVRQRITQAVSPCVSDPCQNGGTCSPAQRYNYQCTCAEGFDGRNCENEVESSAVNHCDPNPCQNEGSCTDNGNGYTCACSPGWTGNTCDTDVDECASQPCMNGATCVNEANAFTCTCAQGYTDATCSTDIDECGSSPCQNGGECQDEVNRFTCKCQGGWSGETCTEDIDECASEPCQSGGTCEDGVNLFSCTCPNGWEGEMCENSKKEPLANASLDHNENVPVQPIISRYLNYYMSAGFILPVVILLLFCKLMYKAS